jgi:hypothetical protein
VYYSGITCLVECKDKDQPLNVEPIAKLRNQLLRRPAGVIGILISRSGFTAPARTLASFVAPQTILLWEGAELDYVLRKESIGPALQRKFRYCIERGAPDCNLCEEAIP